MTGNSRDDPRVIGRDIPWAAVRGRALRVLEYRPFAEAREGKDLFGRENVKDVSGVFPYALLTVEQAEETKIVGWEDGAALLPVCHRVDFRGIDQAMAMSGVDTEVLLFYAPIRFPWYLRLIRRTMPTMIVWVCLKGFWQRFNDRSLTGTEWAKTTDGIIWRYEPLYDRFHGRWSYEE